MITARTDTAQLFARLEASAARLAEERGAGVVRTLRRGPSGWRSADALWPDLMNKGT